MVSLGVYTAVNTIDNTFQINNSFCMDFLLKKVDKKRYLCIPLSFACFQE